MSVEAARIPSFWEDFSSSKCRGGGDSPPLKCQGIKSKESLRNCHSQEEPEETKHILGGNPGQEIRGKEM